MAKGIEELLGKSKDPSKATPSGEEDQEENPLEKMDKISKEKDSKKPGSKTLNEDVISQMFKTGENTEGMFEPKNEEEVDGVKLHEEEDEKAKFKMGDKINPQGKYEKQFKNDMLKHPDEYKVMTPRGEMTVAEALKAGYNPITKRFEKGHGQDAIREKHLSQLNEEDRTALERFTSPANAQVAPADAEMYGLQAGSPMIKPQEQPAAMPPVPQQGTPIGSAMPGSQESTAPGGVDLSSLLGGAQ